MTEDFDRFLAECLSQDEKIFVPLTEPVYASEIALAESNLSVNLPDSYKHFLMRCGSGEWCNEPITRPIELFDFDSDCLEMEGFIALVGNVRGVGDSIAFNPKDSEVGGERPVYYCSHDSFGYVKIAESFEDWLCKTVEAQKQNIDLYEHAIQLLFPTI